jgi:hypothetical protein
MSEQGLLPQIFQSLANERAGGAGNYVAKPLSLSVDFQRKNSGPPQPNRIAILNAILNRRASQGRGLWGRGRDKEAVTESAGLCSIDEVESRGESAIEGARNPLDPDQV